MCEPILFKHTDKNFIGVVYRPATVCGYRPRQRLDLSVNILTNLAINKGNITVFGGSQLRPNLHIQDYADLCKVLLEASDEKIANEIFNCGYENMSIMEIAETVKKVVAEEFPNKDEISISYTKDGDLTYFAHLIPDSLAGDTLPEEIAYNIAKMFLKDMTSTNWQEDDWGLKNKEQKKQKHPIQFCKRPWMETFINWNGDVFPCGCVATERKYSMGNAFETDFKEIWNGEKYIAARKELLDQPNDLETICHLCKANGYYTP